MFRRKKKFTYPELNLVVLHSLRKEKLLDRTVVPQPLETFSILGTWNMDPRDVPRVLFFFE